MKAYGVPRVKGIDQPDIQDVRRYGLRASLLKSPGKSGVTRSTFKDPAQKQAARRVWAKKQRRDDNQAAVKDLISSQSTD